ncbi:hypothetical protein QBC36DRAFT_128404 [Triangularia setosa]|uniref:Uncharacterized protein n=1 Tax=Triangularia setosa TaxID=2587417 RepID=A0AAN6W8W1_9PEZI|nr:hypothetical protein QBC36DRAFT_128404 [Podospora setosa]
MTNSKSSGSRSTGNPDTSYDDWYHANGYYLETFWKCHRCGFGAYTMSTTPQCLDMDCQHRGPCSKCQVTREWVRIEQ